MRNKLSNRYLDHMKRFIKCQEVGELINIEEVYEDYGKPKFMSPRRVLRYRPLRLLTGYLIKENNYEIEKIIMYRGKDVYVNYDLAVGYLNQLDISNYLILNDKLMISLKRSSTT